MVPELLRALLTLVFLISSCSIERNPIPAPNIDDADRILDHFYGERRSDAQSATPFATTPWQHTRVFTVVNYTWPHTPGAVVALDSSGAVHTISGLTDGLRDPDAPTAFNALAKRENRQVQAGDARDYLRFALRAVTGIEVRGSEEAVGLLDEDLDTSADRAHLTGSLAPSGGDRITIDVDLHLADGTLEFREPKGLATRRR